MKSAAAAAGSNGVGSAAVVITSHIAPPTAVAPGTTKPPPGASKPPIVTKKRAVRQAAAYQAPSSRVTDFGCGVQVVPEYAVAIEIIAADPGSQLRLSPWKLSEVVSRHSPSIPKAVSIKSMGACVVAAMHGQSGDVRRVCVVGD